MPAVLCMARHFLKFVKSSQEATDFQSLDDISKLTKLLAFAAGACGVHFIVLLCK